MAASSNHRRVIFIGIAGASCSGKSTYARHLSDHLHSSLNPIEADSFYMRAIPMNHPILGRTLNEELPETIDIDGLFRLLRQIKYHPEQITRYHRNDMSINDKNPLIVIVEGFILFALSNELTNMFDIRIFFEGIQSDCRLRRYRRHYKIKEGTVPDDQITIPHEFQQWFDYLVWEEYLKQRHLQISKCDKVFQPDEYLNKQYWKIDNFIDQRLKEIINK